ncbi:hypothetical protein FRB99_002792 [Tulasnella sp. 403]|nr:hypothetical protein FRB99_002792 [Tulasnella sp. 403]
MFKSSQGHARAAEQELATALVSLKPFLLRRSWISIPKKDSEIGVGGFGTVHRAEMRRGLFTPKTVVAVKKLYTTGEYDKRLHVALELVRELTIQASLDHPNILPLLGFYLSTKLDEAWLVSPYASNGNIYDYLERVNPGLDKRLEMAKDTAKGLEYLHTRNPPICHGDIKALNVLVAENTVVMLCDFGLSKSTESMTAASTTNNAGTSRYWSPELFQQGNRPTLESDVWAWGCLLLEVISRHQFLVLDHPDVILQIVTGLAPYNDIPLEGRVIHQITENILPAQLDTLGCPTHVRDLLGQCWKIPSGERPKMQEVVSRLTAGNLHFFAQGSVSMAVTRASTQSTTLERELTEFLLPLEKHRIKPSRLLFRQERESVIGMGGFGTVHRAHLRRGIWGNSGAIVAVKKLRAAGGPDKCLRMAIALIRELAVWSVLSHENIIPLVGFYLSERLDQAWLVSPYMKNGNINDYLINARPDQDKRHQLALDTAKGLQYLHNRDPPICHGDIKALNVLITDGQRAALCDFGLAKTMESMPSGLTTSTFNQGGSLPYESPELLLGKSMRSPESDVWAWGCLLQEIFTGKAPYYWANNVGAIVKWIVQDIPPASIGDLDCPISIRSLLTYCWRTRPAIRPTMMQCVNVLSDESIGTDAILQELETQGDGVPGRARALRRSDMTFTEDSKIGSGRLGVVFEAELVDETGRTDRAVVVKRLFKLKDPDTTDNFLSMVQAKADQWAALRHPHVLSIIGFSRPEEGHSVDVFIVAPYMPGRNIADYIKQRSPDYSERMKYARPVASVIGRSSQIKYPTKMLLTGLLPVDIDKLDCPPRAQNILGLCWKQEPQSRMSLGEIISILSGRLCRFSEAWSISAEGLDCLSFSYDGKFLVVGFSAFGFRVYHAETGVLAYELPLSEERYLRVQMSRSGRYLVASSTKVVIWDLDTRGLKGMFQEHTNNIWALDISSDDSYVISGSHDNTIRVWRPELQTDNSKLLKETDGYITRIVISPIAEVVAISINGSGNELIDANTGQTIAVLERPEHCWSLRFSPDGKRICGGCAGGLVCYWDVGDLLPVEGEVSKVSYHAIRGAQVSPMSTSSGTTSIMAPGYRIFGINIRLLASLDFR